MPTLAGAPTVQRALEVSRVELGAHSWRVTYSDGSTSEDIDWRGCYRPVERAKKGSTPKKRGGVSV